MTLIVTAATRDFIAQVSDRRYTYPSGELFRDDVNKATILECRDGILSFAYTGLGFVGERQADGLGEQRTDDWLVDVLTHNGAAEMRADEAITMLAGEASRRFASFSRQVDDARLSIVVAGWPKPPGWRMPIIWGISNFERFETFEMGFRRSRSSAKPWPEFISWATQPKPQGEKFYIVEVTGRDTAVKGARKQLRRLQEFVVTNSDPSVVTRKLVAFIRRCAHHPKEGKYIGRNCMAVFLSDNYVGSFYYDDDSSRPVVFAPNFVGPGPAAKDIMYGTGKGPNVDEIQQMIDRKRQRDETQIT